MTATADGAAVGPLAQGGSFAHASLQGTTRADVGGSASVSAASVDVLATSTNTVTSSAKSTSGGALQNDADTAAALAANKAATADGSIGVAGAFALTSLNAHTTQASLSTTGGITATGAVHVRSSSSTTSSATADGTPTGGTSGASSPAGFGIAVAIDTGGADNLASLGGVAVRQRDPHQGVD